MEKEVSIDRLSVDRDDVIRLIGYIGNAAGIVTYLRSNWENTFPALRQVQLDIADEHLRGAITVLELMYKELERTSGVPEEKGRSETD